MYVCPPWKEALIKTMCICLCKTYTRPRKFNTKQNTTKIIGKTKKMKHETKLFI